MSAKSMRPIQAEAMIPWRKRFYWRPKTRWRGERLSLVAKRKAVRMPRKPLFEVLD
jgi:hypothetical protein